MTILFADGFEDSQISDYNVGLSGVTIVSGAGRRGGKALSLTSGGSWLRVGLTPQSEFYIHTALYVDPAFSSGAILRFREDTSVHLIIWLGANGAIYVYRGSTSPSNLLYTTPSPVVPTSAYVSLQFRVVISDTVGVVQLKVNGESTLTIDLTNIDTRNSGTGVINNIEIGSSNAQTPLIDSYYDDVVIWDTSGSVNNTWLGDLRVDSYMPTADGDSATMTPSSGTDHYALVDEVPALGADYVYSATVGALDLFQMADMAHTPETVHAVIPVAQMYKSDAGAREVALSVKSGATSSDGSNTVLATGSLKYSRVIESDPNGSVPWTKAAVDALQVGVKVTA